MDLTIILAAISGLVIIILVGFLLKNRGHDDSAEAADEGARRPQAARGARARMRAAAAAAAEHGDKSDEDVDHEKLGAKKRAKLEAKAEKKAQREAEERDREDRKKKKELAEEERAKQAAKEEEEEARKEEEERRAEEERERREHEEYLKMKAAFSVEEEGFDEDERDEADLVEQFIKYIQNNKVVILEDLASEFKLKTQAVIDRIKDLQSGGRLTGVIDDRGKFIYISQEELAAVAKFVKQRGRVSISELAENSQRLINLAPKVS